MARVPVASPWGPNPQLGVRRPQRHPGSFGVQRPQRAVSMQPATREFDPNFATVAPPVDLEAMSPDQPVFDPGGGWEWLMDAILQHNFPTEGLPSGGGLMIGPQEVAKAANFAKNMIPPLMTGDVEELTGGHANLSGIVPTWAAGRRTPLPIPLGQLIKKGNSGIRGVLRALGVGGDEAADVVTSAIRETGEAAGRGGGSVVDEVADLTQPMLPGVGRVSPTPASSQRPMLQMGGGASGASGASGAAARPVGVGGGPIVRRAGDVVEARHMNIAPPADDVVFRTEATVGPLQRQSYPGAKPDASGSEWISTGDGAFSRFSTRPAGTGAGGFLEPKAGWHPELDYVFAPEDVAARIKANPTQISNVLLNQTSQTPQVGWRAIAIGDTQALTHVSDKIVWVKPTRTLRDPVGRFAEPALGTTPRIPPADPRRTLNYGGAPSGRAGLHGPGVGAAGSPGDLIAEMLRATTYGRR